MKYKLNEVPLSEINFLKPGVIITMSTGQWDAFLETGYEHGFTLVELDENENPIKVYRLPVA